MDVLGKVVNDRYIYRILTYTEHDRKGIREET